MLYSCNLNDNRMICNDSIKILVNWRMIHLQKVNDKKNNNSVYDNTNIQTMQHVWQP